MFVNLVFGCLVYLTLVVSLFAFSKDDLSNQSLLRHKDVKYEKYKYFSKDKNSTKIVETLIDFSQSLVFLVNEISQEKYKDPNYNKTTSVRFSDDLCSEEMRFISFRDAKVEQNLKAQFNYAGLVKSPRIALCFSGGGYRALIGTLAVIQAAQEVGLLDITSYISSLSGSTWALAQWSIFNNNIDRCINCTKKEVGNFLTTNFNYKSIIYSALTNLYYDQTFSLVSIWGLLLGNRLLPKINDMVLGQEYCSKLSQTKGFFADGKLPLPIFTAALVEPNDQYDWIEFTPFEIGSVNTRSFVPSWSFNRTFKYGENVKYAPEPTFDLYFGIWGSAFTADIEEILLFYKHKLPQVLYKPLNYISTNNEAFGDWRLCPAKVKNFTYKSLGHPWGNRKSLTLVDAGLISNIPLQPLLRKERNVDLVIIFDFSDGLEDGPELAKALKYAKNAGCNVPSISTQNLHKEHMSVFQSTNTPTIIYMPCIKNEKYSNFDPVNCIKQNDYCASFNLSYNSAQFEEYFGLAKFNFLDQWPVLKKVIEKRSRISL